MLKHICVYINTKNTGKKEEEKMLPFPQDWLDHNSVYLQTHSGFRKQKGLFFIDKERGMCILQKWTNEFPEFDSKRLPEIYNV